MFIPITNIIPSLDKPYFSAALSVEGRCSRP